jgi:HTH-type transcriptional regulator/antitoxin HigA
VKSLSIANIVPPGIHLKREMEARGWSQSDLAEILGRPLQAVNQILKGKKAITSSTARELEDATDIAAETWLNLEALYRLSMERKSDDLVTERAQLFSRAPVADLRRRGWVRDTRDIGSLRQDVLRLLKIESLTDPPRLSFAARKSTDYGDVLPEQEAWCCRAYQLAERMKGISKFVHKRFAGNLDALRRLGASIDTIGQLPGALAALGIRFLVVEHLPRTKIDGATLWLNKKSPVVVLSLRYGRIDHFLFTLFHELSHVRHQDARSIDSEIMSADNSTDEMERRANEEAAAVLVPPAELSRFLKDRQAGIGKTDIARFSRRIEMHPGVVLGQLQFRGLVGWSACREFLVPIRESIAATAVTDGWGQRP